MTRQTRVRLIAAHLFVFAVVGIFVAIQWVLGLPKLPYNVRELFPDAHPNISMAVLSVLLVWLGLGPAFVADFLIGRPRQLFFLPLWAASIGLVSWCMLRFAVTRESLGDVAGGQTWDSWSGDWELLCRFLALQGTVTLPLLIAGVVVGSLFHLGWRNGLKRGALAIACGLPWLILAWTFVIGYANSDNLTQLIRSTPSSWTGPALLTALMFLLCFNVSLLSYAWVERGARGVIAKAMITFATPFLVMPGWELLSYGLEPAVEEYGITFPAVRFLLGPDRSTDIPIDELAMRWNAVQLGITVVLAVGGVIGLCLGFGRPDLTPSGVDDHGVEDHSAADEIGRARSELAARIYLIMTVVCIGFLIFGSLIPFSMQPVPLGDAMDAFRDAMQPARTKWSQSDVIINLAAFVPLTFCALGAWTCRNQRWERWWVAVPIFLAGVFFSCLLEFAQVFAPTRTTSIHDIISQTIGNVLGLAMWLAFGPSLTQWTGDLARENDRVTLRTRLLYTYAALLCLYSLLPLNLTISAGQIWRKYKAGMISFVPFSHPDELRVHTILLQTILYVPIGYLLACRAGRRGNRLVIALVGGVLFAAVFESLQVLVASRFATVTDVLLGALGALAGGLVACFVDPTSIFALKDDRWFRVAEPPSRPRR